MNNRTLIGLDVGEKRIGVAVATTGVRIAVPYATIEVDGDELAEILTAVVSEDADTVVIGYPRNQSGEPTAQTDYVSTVAKRLEKLDGFDAKIVFQDESLTSVLAEDRLKSFGKPYQKGDIDAQAAAIILQDYIEAHYA